MLDWYVGMKVVCLHAQEQYVSQTLVEGDVYVIKWLGKYTFDGRCPGVPDATFAVRLDGVKRVQSNGNEWPYGNTRFQPLVSLEAVDQLIQKIKIPELTII